MGAKIKKMFSRITIITLFAIMAPNALAQSPQMMRGMMGTESPNSRFNPCIISSRNLARFSSDPPYISVR